MAAIDATDPFLGEDLGVKAAAWRAKIQHKLVKFIV